jgi:DNA-binding IclR family transcriptional regulator
MTPEKGPSRMVAHDKILAVLGAFSIERPSMTLSEIARATDLPTSTVHRLVTRLSSWGALERDHRRRYVIGFRLWQLGMLSPRFHHQRAHIVPFLERLYMETRQPAVLSAFHADGSVVVEQHLGWRDVNLVAGVGERLPVHATSPGLILLAFGPPGVWGTLVQGPLRQYTSRTVVDLVALRRIAQEVRRTSIAVSEGALVSTTCSMSAPVFGHRGELYGAVSIVWTAGRFDPSPVAPKLLSTAQRISSALRESADESLPHPVRRGVYQRSR